MAHGKGSLRSKMILAQHFNSEEDFYAIPLADIYTNEVSDAVNWQTVLPGKQVVKVASNINFVKWQQHGFKIKIENKLCKLFSVKAKTEEKLLKVEVSHLFSKIELPCTLEIELQKEEDGKVVFIVDNVKNAAVEVRSQEAVFCKSNHVELELIIDDATNLPEKFLVELTPHLAHELQAVSLV